MKFTLRWAAVLGLVVLAFGLLADVGMGQKGGKGKGKGGSDGTSGGGGGVSNSALYSSVKIIEDAKWRKTVEVGRDLIRDDVWKDAVMVLQKILDEKEDFYVQVHERDPIDVKKENIRWTSVKFEANNLIGSMKDAGLEQYELTFGADAKAMLDEAKRTGDRDLVAEVAQRYCHTKAGIEANEILATLFLARGQVFSASLRFESLLQMSPERTKLSDLTLFKAAVAFRRAGDTKKYEETWDKLQKKLDGRPLGIGKDMVPLAKLQAVLNEVEIHDPVNRFDWPMVRGDNRHTAQAIGSPPLLDTMIWKRPIMLDKLDGLDEIDPDQPAEQRVAAAMKQVAGLNQAVLPGFFPIASQGVLIYRSQRDVRAVALKDIKIKDDNGETYESKAGQILWKTIPLKRSLSVLLEKAHTRGKTEQWLDNYNQVPGFNSFLYDNSLIGTLSTDGRNVYVIDDLAVPPHPTIFNQQFGFNPQFQAQEMKPLYMQNELAAYDIFTGKLRWDLTGADEMFKDSHFLSMPISVGGKLYVLNEKLINPNEGVGPNPFGGVGNSVGGESELRLVCIDPSKISEKNKPSIVGKPQSLGNVVQFNRFVQDIGRRVNAVHLAFGEGTLVCPTNAGEIFGIDVMTRSLVWSYPYRESEHRQIQLPGMPFQPNPLPGKQTATTTTVSKWKSSPPAIQDGKIVFTAPDADSVHCISLRDGKPIWKRGQIKGDLYMAGVYNGRVLIVGDTQVRILDLKTGDQLKSISTGDLPSGQGVASKGIYYLPLKKGEILAIDIAKGEVKAHNRAAVQNAAPGNLIFYEGLVLSQTPTEIVAYPQLTARLDIAKAEATKDPENLARLTDYGDLLLKDGQVHLAVETLLKVYTNKPADPLGKRVRSRLFEALTDLMQVDFTKASKDYLTIYEDLCKVPDDKNEDQLRHAKLYRLVGQGRESQGNLVEAFQMYQKFGALPIHRDGISTPEDPNTKIPINVWLRGRISGMLAKATPKQKAPLEETIAEEWQKVEAKKDVDSIRSFVGMFDIPVKVGRDARIRLAELIMERKETASYLEAELLLYQVISSEYRKDPQSGGRALAALALLEESKRSNDSTRLAAAYYRELARDFAKDAVRGNKTGTDLLGEMAMDKRFLQFLETGSSPWGPVKIASRELPAGYFNVGLSGFVMQPDGDQTPFAKAHRLMLDPSDTLNPRIRLRDLGSATDRWNTRLDNVQMNQQIFFHMYNQQANVNNTYHPNARFRFFHVKGHLIVCQVGVMVYCIDGDTGKELWKMQTVENVQQNGMVHFQQVINDAEGNPEIWYWNQLNNSRFKVSLGRIGTAQASYVAVLSHKGLTVVEPIRGGTMWKKPDVPINSHVFGDDQYLFLVEMNENGSFGAGRTIRASDGEVQDVPDFSSVYQARVKIEGRTILAARTVGNDYVVRLYDIIAGKDIWTKNFPQGSQVLHTEDNAITGVVDLKGNVTIMAADTGKELLTTNIVQHRITTEDLRGLRDPLLLQDGERYYIALNKEIDKNRVGNNGAIFNNFNNGARCLPVNGWFVFIQKNDGKRKLGEREITWKKGDVSHSYVPIVNQMLVMEQFDQSPVILFTARYNEVSPNGGNRWVSITQALSKTNCQLVAESRPANVNGVSPMFTDLRMDMKARTLNLIGFGGSIQFYVDDGKGPPAAPGAAALTPGGTGIATPFGGNPGANQPIANPIPPNGRVPVIRRLVELELQPVPPIDIAPPNAK